MNDSHRRVASCAIAAICLSVNAQVELPRLSEIIEVRVTNIDVVVTDKLGRRVHGLTKDDFEVYDGGKRQEITNLSEIIAHAAEPSPAAAPAESPSVAASISDPPPRRIVVFFDSASTSPIERRRVAPAIAKLIGELRPNDEAMIVSWNRRLNIVVPPTSDRAKLEQGLERAVRELSLGSGRTTMFDHLIDDNPAQRAERTLAARRHIREASADLTESVRGLNGILTRLAGIDGRKALILISSAFSFRPGAEAADPSEGDALLLIEDVRAPELLKALTSAANSAGVTIYTMHAAGLESGMSVTDVSAQQSLARMQSVGSGIDGLTYIAARTGGLVTANTNGFMRAVEKISEDLGNYYSIGYRTAETRRDGERAISVRTRNRSYTVRARRSVLERSFETELADRVVSALLFPATGNQLRISAKALRNDRRRRNRYAIPVDVNIPMSSLALVTDGDGLSADISIFIASADATGSMSKVARFNKRIPVKREQLKTLGEKIYTYGMDVDLRSPSAENRLSIAVLDNVSKATGLVTVDVKPAP